MNKRVIGWLLCLAMVLAMLPTGALAADDDFVIDEEGVLRAYQGPGGDVVIPDGVTSIGTAAFSWFTNLTSVVIPEGVTSIEDNAFYGCSNLEKVQIPDSVVEIGLNAFRECYKLESIVIPEHVTSIGVSAFQGCHRLKSITLPEQLPEFGTFAFKGCYGLAQNGFVVVGGVLFDQQNLIGDVVIPDGVTEISQMACIDALFTSVEFPDSLKTIGEAAFMRTRITELNIPDSVETIGKNAFSGCKYLKSVKLSNGLTEIADGAFASCNHITEITIPDSVTRIGDSAFEECSMLGTATLPEALVSIGENAFKNCTGLWYCPIPAGVQEIGSYAFGSCEALMKVSIPGGVKTIGDWAFGACKALAQLTIGEGVTSIGAGAFYKCGSLKEVTIPDSVSQIGIDAFWSCTGLETLRLGAGTAVIADTAFQNCGKLKSVKIPPTVTSIGTQAFGYENSRSKYYDFTICGVPGTAAEAYATENGFAFVKLAVTDFLTRVPAVQATCTAPGSIEYWTDGTHYYADADGKTEITQKDTAAPALGHAWSEWTVVTSATEEVPGMEERLCARCGETEQWELPPVGTTASLVNFVPFQSYNNQFTDVPAGAWYHDSVAKAYELGLVKGASPTNYNRKGDIKIGETIALACRIRSIYLGDGEEFAAAEGEKWYDPYVHYAIVNDIIREGEYEVYNVPATREQFAAILAKALPVYELNSINNVAAIPDLPMDPGNEHVQLIYLLYNAGVLTGNDSLGTFTPNAPIKRSEVAAIIVRMAVPAERKSLNLG